ncbi:MAG: hypothetical protein FWG98_08270 [Candidatus Cloacimonetes bacterium]|nr:hypothetical protein [Candidatus Cloacimonadota bacterium]
MSKEPPNVDFDKSCGACIHFIRDDKSLWFKGDFCKAFPTSKGIPEELYFNGHYEPRPDLGQENNLVFEPDKEFIKKWKKFKTEHRKSREEKLKKLT